MNESLPLCGTLPHCDQIVLDAFERFFSQPEIIRHLNSKKAAVQMALSLCALMRDRGNIPSLADRGEDWGVGKDGTVSPWRKEGRE
ncbi:MAG: hypothetical protein IKR86_09165 [Candidatus Methanomethylophilaceae archaeon]|nr:hypothetical protein [Candidatus Methanomethylophilaceae archaeon]